jgi:hypothetical protein
VKFAWAVVGPADPRTALEALQVSGLNWALTTIVTRLFSRAPHAAAAAWKTFSRWAPIVVPVAADGRHGVGLNPPRRRRC